MDKIRSRRLLSFIWVGLVFLAFLAWSHQIGRQQTGMTEQASQAASQAPYGPIQPLLESYVQETRKEDSDSLFTGQDLRKTFEKFKQSQDSTANDPIDGFLSLLPKSYLRHFSLVHQSASIQGASPLSPRVILFGRDARVLMTFNAGKDEAGRQQMGGQSIEVIEWLDKEKRFHFSEIEFATGTPAKWVDSPPKCALCHAGTPKPVKAEDLASYRNYLKPIFPQYPFWPGFYGSINDIVGIDESGSKDTIGRNVRDSVKQVEDLTFSETEELFRLRELMDRKDSPYRQIVEQEQLIHRQYFHQFQESMATRPRYRHLHLVSEMFRKKGEPIPEALRSAPFRRTFDKEYGHYLLRPNFYLTTLLTAYQAQVIAEEISRHPAFPVLKSLLLFKKYNCGNLETLRSGSGSPDVARLTEEDINRSLDLLYPNVATEESRTRQYLLAYQYNVVQSQRGGPPHLPLHAWNIEGNEEIASYHYGNVFSDLNELVLWRLLTKVFPDVELTSGRNAAELRHFEMPTPYFQKPLTDAGAFVSRISQSQYDWTERPQTYADSGKKFVDMPVSIYCSGRPKNSLIDSARQSLAQLADLKRQGRMPHQVYGVLPEFVSEDQVTKKYRYNTHLLKQACDACHGSEDTKTSGVPGVSVPPAFEVDWMSETYTISMQQNYQSIRRTISDGPLSQHFLRVLQTEELPVPFGQQMPYGRRNTGALARQCEIWIHQRVLSAGRAFKFSEIFECGKSFPEADLNSMGCQCFRLNRQQEKLYQTLFRSNAPKETSR